MLQVGEWPILCNCKRSLPKTTKDKLAPLLYTNHQWWEMPLKDPEVQIAVELGLQVSTLQEQSPGVGTQVPSQKGAQSDCQHSPH
jgi:hypothetical protein